MLIPLLCNQCGARLEIENTQVSISEDTVVVLPGQQFKCSHCETVYLPGDKSKHAPNGSAVFKVEGNFSGNIIIGASNSVINLNTKKE
jgi:hypothetical protein